MKNVGLVVRCTFYYQRISLIKMKAVLKSVPMARKNLKIMITSKLKRVIQKRGDFVLFPSSLFPRAIPFSSDDERICITFDLEPM